jgi:DNA (cytosine-5)-methyltransferase 1
VKKTNRRFIHVFGGIDALSVAKPDWEPIAFSEIEPFPCAVLKHHHPDIPNLGDITAIDFTQFQGNAEIYAGGSPCQAFSIAGLRKSLQDTRGNLTLEYIRGFNESECPLGLWENVPGVLSTSDNAFGLFLAGMVGESSMLFPDTKQSTAWLEAEFTNTILRCYFALADFRFFRTWRGRYPKIKWGNAGMVFGPKGSFAWRVLDAQYFNLAQRRERVFGIAFRPRNAHRLFNAPPTEDLTRFLGLPGAILFEPGCVPRNTAPSRQAKQKITATPSRGFGRGSGNSIRGTEEREVDASGCDCCGDGRPAGGTPLVFGGGNGQSLTVATTVCSHGQRNDFESESFVCYESVGYKPLTVSPTLDARCKDGPVRNQVGTIVCFQQNSRAEVRLIDGNGQIAGALTADAGMTQQNYLAFSYKDYGEDAGTISPTLRSAGFKDSHSNSGAPPAIVIKIDHTKSNGWGVLDDGTTHTLGGSTDAVAYSFFTQNTLRRFTPTECLRLQGFPDDYLNITYRGKPAFNGPKYRAIGNSWAVTVARWVGDHVDFVLDSLDFNRTQDEFIANSRTPLAEVPGIATVQGEQHLYTDCTRSIPSSVTPHHELIHTSSIGEDEVPSIGVVQAVHGLNTADTRSIPTSSPVHDEFMMSSVIVQPTPDVDEPPQSPPSSCPIFFLGWHQPTNGKSGCQDFEHALISVNRLLKRKTDFAVKNWILDSGAFTRISGLFKNYKGHLSTRKYAKEIWRWRNCGNLMAAVSQDFMCEAMVLAHTGLTIADHQRLSILRYDNLLKLIEGSGVYLMPVLQGFEPQDYVSHLNQYGDRLAFGAWVGVGSVCKRNGSPKEIERVLSAIAQVRPDLRLHGFGLKKKALTSPTVQKLLFSCDSAAAGLKNSGGTNRHGGKDANDPLVALAYAAEIKAAMQGNPLVYADSSSTSCPVHAELTMNSSTLQLVNDTALETVDAGRVQPELTMSTGCTRPIHEPTKPFLKWAGGKTWAIALVEELYTPHRHRRYRDLTLGSGAIPLALKPDRAYLSDKNPFLIQLWEWVKSDGKLTIDLKADRDYYLECQQRFNAGDPQQAQLLYYLNHTCWRGLYRSSSVKHFNVPWGDYKKFHGQTDLTHYKEVIGGWQFAVESWDEGLRHVQDDDFIVFDPPYHSADGKGFTEYFGSFTEADQVLAAQALSELGVPVVAFNAATDFTLDLYRGLGFDVQVKKAPRMISSTGDRAPALEMVATKNTSEKKLIRIDSFLSTKSLQPPTVPEVTTTPAVEQPEELSFDEERDRAHLERKVEGAFYEAGKALRELRDRRLYRSSHDSFEAYCQDRFDFGRQNAHKKITAVQVIDILSTKSLQILPASVEQAFPLSRLKTDEEKVKAWEKLTQGGKRPSGKKVRDVVDEICNRQAERGEYHNPWLVGDICQIHKKGDGTLAKYDGTWGIVSEVKTRQCLVSVWNGSVLVKPENLESLELGDEFKSVCDRVRSLMSRHMDGLITLKRGQLRFLGALGEQAEPFEPEDVEMLACIEAKADNHDASLVQATRLLVENVEYLTAEEARSLYDALRTTHQL